MSREQVYRAGTPDGKIPPGLYAAYLQKAIEYLEKARARGGSGAGPGDRGVDSLLSDRRAQGLDSVRRRLGAQRRDRSISPTASSRCIAIRAARKAARRASSSITDKPVTEAMDKLAQNASYFENKAPWDAEYKKADVPAAGRQGGRSADRDRRLPRHDDRRQPAQRERDSRAVRHEELPVAREQPRARRRQRRSDSGGVRGVDGGDRARHEVRRGGGGPADRDARGDRPRLRPLERSPPGRRRAVPEGVFLDARGSARRPHGTLEHVGSETEGARADHESGRGRQGHVRQRRARRAHAAAPHSEGRAPSKRITSAIVR